MLFSPLRIRGAALKNRIVISPMCQYSAVKGHAQPWHTVHVGKLAGGGAAAVILEATAVQEQGRITHGDLGIWDDSQVQGLRHLADTIAAMGAVPGIQLGHAGRKASAQRPWHGGGPLTPADLAARGEAPWSTVAASALPLAPAWPTPQELDAGGLAGVCQAFVSAARRAAQAGFLIVELHAAHGYLLHTFLSPLSNQRRDSYGGSLEGRMKFPLEVAAAMRAALPEEVAMFVRISAVDGLEHGLEIKDSVEFAKRLKALSVDVVDCSSGGLGGSATAASSSPHAVRRGPGFQVPFARQIRHEAGIATMAVGLIVDPVLAGQVVLEGSADLVAVGREPLNNPNWALHAARELGVDTDYQHWPDQYGWWLARRPPIA